jgi:hypothetical protein
MIIFVVLLAILIAASLAWAAAAALTRRQDPLLRVARARAQHAMQLRLLDERSRLRAAEMRRRAEAAMDEQRGS